MPQALPPPLLRPAIIELRYEDETKFKTAVTLYEGLLYNAPEETLGANRNIRTFRIGYSKLADHRDMLLRLTYPLDRLPSGADHTVLYWKVAGTDIRNLEALHNELARTLQSVEVPAAYEASSAPYGPPARSLLQDTVSGTLLGLTINPPVPTFTTPDENSNTFRLIDFIKANLLVLLSLLIPVVGYGAFRFGKRQGINQATSLAPGPQVGGA